MSGMHLNICKSLQICGDGNLENVLTAQNIILRWMVELGRNDIITEVSMLASQLALPREGCLEAVFCIFGYMKGHHNARIVFNPTYPNPDM